MVFPTPVQGETAALQIRKALQQAIDYGECDVVLLVRGGGSLEDLWSFNDEDLARDIVGCPIPVVTGVGHEVDFTIADFVSDLRAPTPSVAAAVAVPDRAEVLAQLADLRRWTVQQGLTRLDGEQRHLEQSIDRLKRAHPQRQLDQRRQQTPVSEPRRQ